MKHFWHALYLVLITAMACGWIGERNRRKAIQTEAQKARDSLVWRYELDSKAERLWDWCGELQDEQKRIKEYLNLP